MDLAVVILVEVLYAIAALVLVSAGLAVVFGMMKVINLAHGEFMVLGGYATITAVGLGVNIFVAMLIVAPLVVGLFGLIVERLVFRHLYGRMIDTMLASWGLSLMMIGAFKMIFGNTQTGVTGPIPGLTVGGYQINGYNLFIIVVAVLLVVAMLAVLRGTRAGLIARGAMQRADMAAAMGHSPDRIYMSTFAIGSALAGLAGAVMAPLVGIVPTAGAGFIAKAFITVIAGGPSLVAGLISASGVFGLVNQAFSFLVSPVIGDVALLIAAVILLRLLPRGITTRFFRGRL